MQIGSYEVIEQIGEGGFGRTYKAKHILLDELACVKQNINISPDDAELLKKEAKLLWNVHHHSLPAMRDFFTAKDGSYIMVMSFVQGKTLDHYVKKYKGIDPEEMCWITQRLLNGLYYLHAHGIVHGDVKPQNIILQPKVHNAILVDYGLATLRPTMLSKAKGYTPLFAAPEITEGKPPLPQSDLYSLGLTFIYGLGGDPLAKTCPKNVPPKLVQYIDDLVKYDPKERPDPQKVDLVQKLSDVRLEVFGRRNMI